MAQFLASEFTSFTLDNLGRFLCNTLEEARDSAVQTIAGRRREFDVIVIGGGTFGSVVAEHLFNRDVTRSRRILVLEAGPFVLPEHVQNMPFQGGAPEMRVPWQSHPDLKYGGLIFAAGGRSLTWGGWSPELFPEELADWPEATRQALAPPPPSSARDGYFAQASDQLGVTATNDFIHGPLHTALRKQLHEGLGMAGNETGFQFSELLDHPAVRYRDPTLDPIDAALLREMLDLPPKDKTPKSELLDLLKLEAPLAVQSTTLPGFFPTNKFSAVPGLVRAARISVTEADGGIGDPADEQRRTAADARRRLMVVPNCHVQDLITETQGDGWVRVTGVRVWQDGASVEIPLAPPRNGGQSVVVIALGTVETTRLALATFQQSLSGRAAQRMGKNLVAHLRSNLTIRVPRQAIEANLPPVKKLSGLQSSALLVKGKASNGRTFHFQITASGLQTLGTDSEAELFKKIPTLEHLQDLMRASDDTVVITIRGIGDMTPHNPDSFVELSKAETDFDRPKAVVHLGNAKATPNQFLGSAQTQNDRTTWDEMDAVANKLALIFAGEERFEILAGERVIPVEPGTREKRLAAVAAFESRRDNLGTTHHDAGTLRMGDDIADAVTNDFGRIHDTTNCYVASPALFPTVGSPNPMLTGVALARRTGDLLNTSVLPKPGAVTSPQSESGFRPLFDGTAATFKKWSLAGAGSGGMAHLDGEMVSQSDDGKLRLFYYATELFEDFTLRLQFRIFDPNHHNSGVFLRFPRPTLDLPQSLQSRVAGERSFDPANPAWKPVVAGFEVQIDDNARGDTSKDFYGIWPEPDGLFKNRTGAIYKIPAGDRVWHQGFNEPEVQAYSPGPLLVPDVWFELEITVQDDDYTVFLTNLETGERKRTTSFHNTDAERARAPGCVGIQVYPGSVVAWRHVRIKTD